VPQGGTLTIRLAQDVTTLNPFFIPRSITEIDEAAQTVTSLIFSGLTRLDNRLQPVPDLAESWTPAPDGLSVDFTLRAGALWSDGQPVTVDDVTWTYQSYLKLPTPSTVQVHLQDAVLAIEPSKAAPNTVRFWLKRKYAGLLTDVAAPILPKHLLADVPLDRMAVHPYSYKPVGSGPFVFQERKEGQSILLAANPRYYGGAPHLAGVAFLVAPDPQVAVNALADGSLLAAEVPAATWQAYAARPGIQSVFTLGRYADTGYYFAGFNLRPGHLFSDTALRQAFAYALDKGALVREATGDAGVPIWSDVPPSSWAYAPDTPRLDHDPAKAQALLDGAGWKPGKNGIRQKDGKLLAFPLYVPLGDATRQKAAELMQAPLAAVGISMTVTIADFDSVLKAKLDPRRDPAFDFDAMLLGWDSSSTDPDDFALFHSSQIPTKENPGGLNFTGFAAPEFDQRAVEARSAYDFSARAAAQARMQAILAEELPYEFLWADGHFLILSRRLGGPVDPTSPRWLWNVEQWWLAPAP
jgi:peptide/nickel transport system substrate-binding protein